MNNAMNAFAFVGGGEMNSASACGSAVIGGNGNNTGANCSAIAGGASNTTSSAYSNSFPGYSFVGGGQTNSACGGWGFIGGGSNNTIAGGGMFSPTSKSGILAGCQNYVGSEMSGVLAGQFNNTTASASAVTGGCFNMSMGAGSVVSGCSIMSMNSFVNHASCFAAGNLSGGGAICANSSGIIVLNPSDARLKCCIQPVGYQLCDINKLVPSFYEFNSDNKENGEGKQVGFIAQQVKDVVPESVKMTFSGYYSFDSSKLIPILTKGVQILISCVDSLTLQLEELRNK
jgi:hypothetical protein